MSGPYGEVEIDGRISHICELLSFFNQNTNETTIDTNGSNHYGIAELSAYRRFCLCPGADHRREDSFPRWHRPPGGYHPGKRNTRIYYIRCGRKLYADTKRAKPGVGLLVYWL